jgi:hypothetical protein
LIPPDQADGLYSLFRILLQQAGERLNGFRNTIPAGIRAEMIDPQKLAV